MARYSGTVIELVTALPSTPQPNQFYLVESGGVTELYLSDSKANLILLNGGSVGGPLEIGADVISGTPGSVLFIDTATKLGEDNAHFYWDDVNNRLQLLDNTYVPVGSADTPFSISSNDFSTPTPGTVTTSNWWFNLTLDTKLTASGASKIYTGVYTNLTVGGSYTGGTLIGHWVNVSNELNEGNLTSELYGGNFTANADSDTGLAVGVYADAIKGNTNNASVFKGVVGIGAAGYGAATTITGGEFQARSAGGGALTAGTLRAVQAKINIFNSSTPTSARGLALEGWSINGSVATSYGIYADTSIDIGTTKYFIYSLSTSPSLFSGNLTVTAQGTFNSVFRATADSAYDATAWNGSNEFATKDTIRDKIESLAFVTDILTVPAWNAKGDLIVGQADNLAAILPVGTDGYSLVADSTQPLGVKWATGATAIGKYREFVYILDGIGGFDFVVDSTGAPIYVLSDLE